ncbi:hypothetical protein [Gracilibacillus salinarum]|uniref:YpzI family protein n=1 Tax=Gracilibacillus salinarum TaxID=2932255 RepID=A0ABY4GLT7_9BACI|nr:hypothetical protein [Gracilibacillus salinarum]UOQ85194.1 hypothetical protein MUN87_21535 [Gracilibacillus salinarum]
MQKEQQENVQRMKMRKLHAKGAARERPTHEDEETSCERSSKRTSNA